MNLAYFGLRSDPFPDLADPRFFFDTRASLAAIAALRQSVKARRGILVFSGAPGTGKTLLLKHMARAFEQTTHCLYTNQTYLPFEDLRSLVADGLGLPRVTGSGPPDGQALNTRLLELQKDGEAAVVLLDEAQALDTPTLGEIGKLSPQDPASDRYLLQLILCGTPELEERLEKPEFQPLRERLAPPVRLGDLAPEEVAPFIEHRLRLAGCSSSELFSPNAIAYVTHYAGRVPGAVNSICASALRIAFRMEREVISADVIEAAVVKLGWIDPPTHRTRARDSFPELEFDPVDEAAELEMDDDFLDPPRERRTRSRLLRYGMATALVAATCYGLIAFAPPQLRAPALVLTALIALLLGMPASDRRRNPEPRR